MHAYVDSELGRRRWFLHERGGTPIANNQQNLSYLQQQFIVLGHNKYGQTRENLPPQARKYL